MLLNRLQKHLKGLLPESQCGFRKGRGTVDTIFTPRQLQERCRKQNLDLYTTFVGLTKASDTVDCNGLWKVMCKFGYQTVQRWHASVLDKYVKQGCVLAPTLFSMVLSAMLNMFTAKAGLVLTFISAQMANSSTLQRFAGQD